MTKFLHWQTCRQGAVLMTKTSNRLFSEPQILFDRENHREWLAFAKQIITTNPMPAFVVDGQQRLLLWNNACAQLTGLQQEQVPAAVDHAVRQDDTPISGRSG